MNHDASKNEELPHGLSLDDPQFEAELERRFSDGTEGVSWETLRQQLMDNLNQGSDNGAAD